MSQKPLVAGPFGALLRRASTCGADLARAHTLARGSLLIVVQFCTTSARPFQTSILARRTGKAQGEPSSKHFSEMRLNPSKQLSKNNLLLSPRARACHEGVVQRSFEL